jgi:hypothetical protein
VSSDPEAYPSAEHTPDPTHYPSSSFVNVSCTIGLNIHFEIEWRKSHLMYFVVVVVVVVVVVEAIQIFLLLILLLLQNYGSLPLDESSC